MVDARTLRRWSHWGVFIALTLLCVFLYLLPLRVGSGHWPGPDLIVATAFAWVLRRPNFIPVWLAGAVFIFADFLFQRPPGLWAALSLLGLEFLRVRAQATHEMALPFEFALVTSVMLGMAAAYHTTLAIFFVEQASLGLVILGQLSTLLAYPLVVLVSVKLLGVHKPTLVELEETMGQG